MPRRSGRTGPAGPRRSGGGSDGGPSRPEPARGRPRPDTDPSGRLAVGPQARPARTAPTPGLVLLGEFGRAHGLAGEVRLKSYTADPAAIAGYGPLSTDDGRFLTLSSVRPASGGAPDMLVARVQGTAGREAAEALLHVRLYAPRETLGRSADEDEFYAADLVGLAAVDPAGARLGTIVAVPNYGGGDLLEIAPAAGPTALLPFTKAFVPTIDIAGRRVVVDPPEDLFAPARPGPGAED